MINQDSINDLKDRLNIADIIGQFVTLKKKGADWVGLCPFHGEKSPSFTVSPSKRIYKCFGCGRSGDAIKFIEEHEHKSYVETIRFLAAQINFSLEEESPPKDYQKPVARLEKMEPETIKYFEEHRKISNNTLLRFKVTDAVEWMPKAKKEIPVICFNYYRDGELINTKFRGKDHDFKMVKGAELIFYNLDAIKDDTECIICEGEVDAMSWYEAGFYNVVSVPNGGAVNAEGLRYLDNCYQYFENKTKIILATDGDAVGFGLREELARRLGKDKCYKINYPEEKVIQDKKKGGLRACKDANEVLIHFRKETLKAMAEKAVAWPIEDVLLVGEHLIEEIYNFWENGFPRGIAVGIRGFDELIRFQPGQFTTITGIPGHGKSEFLDEIIGRSIMTHSWKWGICSFENQPSSLHAIKVMQKIARRAFSFRHNTADRMNQQEFEMSLLKTHEYCSFINISTADLTIDGILNKFTELVFRRGCLGFVIDPWNYIEESIPPGMSETKYISQCLSKIHLFCLKTGAHLFLVAHPTKMGKEANGKFIIPNLYSISGSAHFYNKTDNGITVYKDEDIVGVYIQKVRYEWNGHSGFCQFTYNTQTRQYHPVDQISAVPQARLFIEPSNKQFDED